MIRKILVFIGICAIVIIIMVFMLRLFYEPVKSPAEMTPPIEDTLRTPAPGEVRNYYTKQKLDKIMNDLQIEFKGADIKYRYDHDNAVLYFEVTDPTYDEYFIEEVKEGNRQCQTMWELFSKKVIAQQKRIQNIVANADAYKDDDTCIVFRILDPRNSSKDLLVAANGIAGYDAAKDIELTETEA